MPNFSSLPFFASSTGAPLIDVPTVYDEADHPWHKALLTDLSAITPEELEAFQRSGSVFLHHLEARHDRDTQLRIYFTIEEMGREIGRLRKQILSDRSSLSPYDHPDLKAVSVDENGLVYMSAFQSFNGGFSLQDEVFTLAPSTNQTNACYWLLQELRDPHLSARVKIRLDPLVHHPKAMFNPMHFRMQVYGKTLDWDRIRQLAAPEQLEFIPDPGLSRNVSKTELVWKPNGDEIHLTCEELPVADSLSFRGSRYFHAIFNRSTGKIDHCDGAIRYYDEQSYSERCRFHIKANEATKAGIRIKIFHVTEPSHQSLINLVTSYFVWNQDIFDYFNRQYQSL
jgi:hypothetical protein